MGWLLGDFVQQQLEVQGVKPSKFAKDIKVSYPYLLEILQGGKSEVGKKRTPPKISVDVLEKIAKGINRPFSDLFLAYKGIHPDDSKEKNSELHSVIHLIALEAGLDLSKLSKAKKEHLLAEVDTLSREIIRLIVKREMARI